MFEFRPHAGVVSFSVENESSLREVCDSLYKLGVLPEWEEVRQHDREAVLNSGPVMGLKYRIHFTGRGGGWLDIQSA